MIPIVSGLVSLATGWITGRQKIQQAKQAQVLAESRQKSKLLADKNSNNHSWELAALAADRLAALRMMSFWLFTLPIIYAVYDPIAADKVWDSLDSVPDWIIGVQLSMTGFIWAAKPLSNLGAMITGRGKQ